MFHERVRNYDRSHASLPLDEMDHAVGSEASPPASVAIRVWTRDGRTVGTAAIVVDDYGHDHDR